MARSKLTRVGITTSLFALTYAAHAATYYVATNGSDANPGTLAAPWRSVAKGFGDARPGDTVYFRGGIYRQNKSVGGNITRTATAASPILFKAYNDEDVVITTMAPISGWTYEGNNVYSAPLNAAPTTVYRVPNCSQNGTPLCLATKNGDPGYASSITRPGQWARNVTENGNGKLYIRTSDDQHPDNHTIELCQMTDGTYTPCTLVLSANSGRDYLTFDGLDFFGSYYPVYIGSNHITIKNARIGNCYADAIKIIGDMSGDDLWNAEYGIIQNCEILNFGESAIDLTGGDRWTIRDNIMHHGVANRGELPNQNYSKASGIMVKNSAVTVLVERNTIYNIPIATFGAITIGGGCLNSAPERYEAEDVIVKNNSIYDVDGLWYVIMFQSSRNGSFYNNLVANCSSGPGRPLIEMSVVGQNNLNPIIKNNLFVDNNSGNGLLMGENPWKTGTYTGLQMDYNLVPDGLRYEKNDVTYDLPAFRALGYEAHSKTNQPQFANATARDFRPAHAEAPQVDAAFPNASNEPYNPYATNDIDMAHLPRVTDGNSDGQATIDIGPYEFDGPLTYALTLHAAHGSITKTPNLATYQPDDIVTLQVTPAPGYVFTAWTGDLTGNDNPANVLMNSNKNITANFAEADLTAPAVAAVTCFDTTLEITFNEPLDTNAAQNPYNYTISNNISVTNATLNADNLTVSLTTSQHTTDILYNLTINNVADLAGNPILAASFQYRWTNGLIAHYRFNQSNGDIAIDDSGHQNNGLLVDAAYDLGYDGNAIKCLSPAAAVQIPLADLHADQGAIILWAQPHDLSLPLQYLFGHTTEPLYSNRIQLYLAGSQLGLGLGDQHNLHPNIATLQTNRWYHIALVWDNGNYSLYLDGTLQASGNYTGLNAINHIADIANNGNTLARNQAFQGLIDDLRLYHRPVDTPEIAALYAPHTPTAYTVTTAAEAGGTIEPAGPITTAPGNQLSFTITPQPGFTTANVLIDGVSKGPLQDYTFPAIDADHVIAAQFAPITYTLNTTPQPGGTIQPAGPITANHGDNITFTFTPLPGFAIADVLIDGASQGPLPTYTFTNLDANHSIAAQFANLTYSIIADAGTGGAIQPAGTITATHGDDLTFTFNAQPGFVIDDVLVDGASQGPLQSYTFTHLDTDHIIFAQFAELTYTLTTTTQPGGTIQPAGPITAIHGDQQTFTITPQPGFTTTDVLIDGVSQGPLSTYTFTDLNADHTITAQFNGLDYSVTATANQGGTISPSGTLTLPYGADQTFTITPAKNFRIANVLLDGVSLGSLNSCTLTAINASHLLEARFVPLTEEKDTSPPIVTNCTPAPDDAQIPLNSLVILHLVDPDAGVDPASVRITFNDQLIYAADTPQFQSDLGFCSRSGENHDFLFAFQPANAFDVEQNITITVDAHDLQQNTMPQFQYNFTTVMQSFGGTNELATPPNFNAVARPATTCDADGTIWLTWQAGPQGHRQVFVATLDQEQALLQNTTQIAPSKHDQCNPVITVGPNGCPALAWQDNRNGQWDIYLSQTNPSKKWAKPARIDNSQANQTNPAIAAAENSTNILLVYQDDRDGHSDIYLAASQNGFKSQNIRQITNHPAQQTQPTIALDNNDNAYLAWTDTRNGNPDLYAAISNNNYLNIPLVDNNKPQYQPAIAVEPGGNILHLTWVDESAGNQDIFYAATNGGLPNSPLNGICIVDDDSDADQTEPTLQIAGDSHDDYRVFASWQDGRNINVVTGDSDIYFVEPGNTRRTNVLVTDDDWNAAQQHPALGINANGDAYLVWIDGYDDNATLCYAGASNVEPLPVAAAQVSPDQNTIVGTPPQQIASTHDVSVEIPQGAFYIDAQVSISKIVNPPTWKRHSFKDVLSEYEFAPSSNLEFAKPVTITIPYEVQTGQQPTAYWYDPTTGQLSQAGIANLRYLQVSDTLHALRFDTTHFTHYLIATDAQTDLAVSSGSGSASGGCSLHSTSSHPKDIIEWLLPYAALALLLIALRIRQKKNTT